MGRSLLVLSVLTLAGCGYGATEVYFELDLWRTGESSPRSVFAKGVLDPDLTKRSESDGLVLAVRWLGASSELGVVQMALDFDRSALPARIEKGDPSEQVNFEGPEAVGRLTLRDRAGELADTSVASSGSIIFDALEYSSARQLAQGSLNVQWEDNPFYREVTGIFWTIPRPGSGAVGGGDPAWAAGDAPAQGGDRDFYTPGDPGAEIAPTEEFQNTGCGCTAEGEDLPEETPQESEEDTDTGDDSADTSSGCGGCSGDSYAEESTEGEIEDTGTSDDTSGDSGGGCDCGGDGYDDGGGDAGGDGALVGGSLLGGKGGGKGSSSRGARCRRTRGRMLFEFAPWLALLGLARWRRRLRFLTGTAPAH